MQNVIKKVSRRRINICTFDIPMFYHFISYG